MAETLHVPKTELARKTRQIIRSVQQGQTVVIESYGEPEAAIIDITDYRLLLAALHHYAHPDRTEAVTDLTDEVLAGSITIQDKYDRVIARYLTDGISLSRAAELLDLPWIDLRSRCQRLDMPLRTAPTEQADIVADSETALKWVKSGSS